MRIQVTNSRQVNECLKSLPKKSLLAFHEGKEELERQTSLPGEVPLDVPGHSVILLHTGELIVLKRQENQQWMGLGEKTLEVKVSHLIPSDIFHNWLLTNLLKERNIGSQISQIDKNSLRKLAISSLDQAGRFDILLKIIPIIAGLAITVLIAITESQGLTNILPNKENPPPSQLNKPPQPD
jgi:hypothetical protein